MNYSRMKPFSFIITSIAIALSFMIAVILMHPYSITAYGESVTISGTNEFKSLKATSSQGTLLAMTFGNSDAITAVDLGFRDAIANGTTIIVTFKDISNNILGSGSAILSSSQTDMTITLSNTVTLAERDNLVKVEVT